jgi:hypothetical protein
MWICVDALIKQRTKPADYDRDSQIELARTQNSVFRAEARRAQAQKVGGYGTKRLGPSEGGQKCVCT